MAMLGLLELMASQDATLDEMLEAAKYVNAFWYPQQTLEQAVYFLKTEGKAYQDVDARSDRWAAIFIPFRFQTNSCHS